MLVSSLALLLLADVSAGASYELSWKPWLRLKKVLTLDNGWSAQSKTCLNAEWAWKRKSGTLTMRLILFLFCSAGCLGHYRPTLRWLQWSEITVKRKTRRHVWGCSRINSLTTCPSRICTENSHRVQAVFEIFPFFLSFFFFFDVKDGLINDQSALTPLGSRAGEFKNSMLQKSVMKRFSSKCRSTKNKVHLEREPAWVRSLQVNI